MSKLEALKKQFQKAVNKLEEVLKEAKSEIVRDSAIKRFEISFGLAWKPLKEYLEDKMGTRY